MALTYPHPVLDRSPAQMRPSSAGARPTSASAALTCGWDVAAVGHPPGLVQVVRSPAEVILRLGDLGVPQMTTPTPDDAVRSVTVVRLRADGTVHVSTRCAPPALVLDGTDVRLLPGDGSPTATAVLGPGDLLVLHSVAVLDADPTGLVDLLNGPGAARHSETSELARRMLADCAAGAAAVARFTG